MDIRSVFRVVGYEIKTPDSGFMDSCNFWVYANTEDEAIKKAKSYKVKKTNYQVVEVIEKHKEFDVTT